MMNILLSSLTILIIACFVEPCALPFWWSEQYHFPQFYQQNGKPKSTFRYRETYAQSNPNNFIHIKEYTQHTWWEHDSTNENSNGNQQPGSGVLLSPNNGRPSPNELHPQDNGFQLSDNGLHPPGKNLQFPDFNREEFEGAFVKGGGVKSSLPKDDVDRMFPSLDNTAKTTVMTFTTTTAEPTTASTTASTSTSTSTTTASTTRRTTTRRSTTPRSTTTSTTSRSVEIVNEREKNEREESNISSEPQMDLEEVAGENINENLVVSSATEKVERSENYLSDLFNFNSVVNETEPCKVAETDIHSMRSMIEKLFSLPRDHMMHPDTKEKAREDILKKFREFGLQVWTQNFTTPPVTMHNDTEESREGVNLIGVIPGSQRGQLSDGIVLVGAHYDTVSNTNGVDDNGSGLAVMLEVARALTQARCRFNNTLMFVAFDHEEDGAMGSNYFVDHYLIPEELKRARAHFQGAFILDGILNFNDAPNTQELPTDYSESLPGLQYFVNNTGNRGNFLAMISRNEIDSHLAKKLMDAWQELGKHQYKLFNLAVSMGNKVPSPPVIERHLNFLRSDHATFWYHNSSSHFPESLNAVLLTDTGPFRGQMKECYHSKCDDLTVMSPEKLQFAKKTADALTATLVELTEATNNSGNRIDPSYVTCLLLFLVFYNLKKSGKL